ncbi:hypothetical protein KXD40_001158 [Peronospora effusa]|uniref:Uncharacterized protein n=1 Tax=Peronospora effusa TaxID=542832 RepID=A0A3M6VDB0_9STRA|nr:hypothetical protein DD238_008557 [Peronospora effusa]RQM18693.1 hypothetical protein DD237_008307 [Peronospora effusa]UIZ21454.1 hypothetical protein KXD40_001158 [Peronospora effusa]
MNALQVQMQEVEKKKKVWIGRSETEAHKAAATAVIIAGADNTANSSAAESKRELLAREYSQKYHEVILYNMPRLQHS